MNQACRAVVCLLAVLAPVLARADEAPRVAALIATAERLLDEARTIRSASPHTRMAAARMVDGGRGIAGQFYREERRFQDDLLGGPPVLKYRNKNATAAQLDLATFDSFVYSAVVATVATCNASDASENLRVAVAELNEAKRDLAGTASDNWEPPEINPDNHNLCR